MQDLVEATHIAITKAVWIAMFQVLSGTFMPNISEIGFHFTLLSWKS